MLKAEALSPQWASQQPALLIHLPLNSDTKQLIPLANQLKTHCCICYNRLSEMCLPCFPWTWTKYEDPYDNLHKAPEQSVWVHDGQNWELQKVVSAILSFIFSSFRQLHYRGPLPYETPSILRTIGL
jgi:hypothetical protein